MFLKKLLWLEFLRIHHAWEKIELSGGLLGCVTCNAIPRDLQTILLKVNEVLSLPCVNHGTDWGAKWHVIQLVFYRCSWCSWRTLLQQTNGFQTPTNLPYCNDDTPSIIWSILGECVGIFWDISWRVKFQIVWPSSWIWPACELSKTYISVLVLDVTSYCSLTITHIQVQDPLICTWWKFC